jgi:hypothetical protein
VVNAARITMPNQNPTPFFSILYSFLRGDIHASSLGIRESNL